MASLIQAANRAHAPIIALDILSGLDVASGYVFDSTIRAATTLSLALPKTGLTQPAAREWVGDLYLADISVPAQVDHQIGLDIGPIFATSDIVAVPMEV